MNLKMAIYLGKNRGLIMVHQEISYLKDLTVGVNSLLLSMAGYESPFWTTKEALIKLGGSIRIGESPHYRLFLAHKTSKQNRQVRN
jgi:hypothetical protein